jgi:protein-L-isoaspartate(D-aspartate) O-methyltransferase
VTRSGRHDASEARRWFAEDLRVTCHLRDERVVRAFAFVPREQFLGPGPWRLRHLADGYWDSPDDDPRWVYHNVLVALDESKGLNNGEPGLWARHFDSLAIRPGERVLQIGAGSGYYTAILAELVGSEGTVQGLEIEAALASAAVVNLKNWPQASVAATDGSADVGGPYDVVVAFAGATAPRAEWLDAMADGGRMLLPMTGSREWGGFMLKVERKGDQLAAGSAGSVGFYPCAGARTADAEEALANALADPVGQRAIKSLRRDSHRRDDTCWLHGAGWCLSKRELH